MPLSRFRGTYEQKMDERGRIAVPARYRSSFEDGGVLIPGPGPELWLYPTAEFNAMAERFAVPGQLGEQARKKQYAVLADAFDVELKGQGRIQIPQKLREKTGLSGSIVVIGVGDRLEVWREEDWLAKERTTFAELLKEEHSEGAAS